MPDVENPKAAETVDVFLAGDVAVAVRSGVFPLDDGRRAIDVRGFAVFEKSGIDVVAKVVDRLANDPIALVGRDAVFGN